MKINLFLLLSVLLLANGNIFSQYQLQNAFPSVTFTSPVDIQNAGDGTDRLFIVEQAGRIKVFQNRSNITAGEIKTYLDITDRVSSGGEMGLLGLAFHPNYENNGYFYVNYTVSSPSRATRISRFQVSAANPDSANKNSELILLSFSQPFTNHNGGQVAFGPDGYLYIATGDGGSGGDPNNNSQNRSNLLGKILRIDVDNPSGGNNYGIPPTNPFYQNTQGFSQEIYAWGLRNPWRMSFDPVTGWLWCADVGQSAREEVNVIQNGKNYGWRCYEGNASYNLSGCGPSSDYTFPVFDYVRSGGNCSVTGGYVYRGPNLPGLYGKYIYGDYCSRFIWSLDYDSSSAPVNTLLLTSTASLTTFGVDLNNELYFTAGSSIMRFVPTAAIVAPSNLQANEVSFGVVQLTWNDNSNNENGFRIERKSPGGNFILIDSVGANVTTYNDNSVADTLYIYRVYAFGTAGVSGYSNETMVVTSVPVELTSFTASLGTNKVILNWITATEENNLGFEISRAIKNEKLKIENWEVIGFVEGNGTTTVRNIYSFEDDVTKVLTQGVVAYRLKQIDYDGSFEFSPVVEIEIDFMPNEYSLLQNYPNPFNPNTVISYQLPALSNVVLKVYDVLGNEVAVLVNETQSAGRYNINFSTGSLGNAVNLSSGIYYYQLTAVNAASTSSNGFVETKKMILIK